MKRPSRRAFLRQLSAVTGAALAGPLAELGGCSANPAQPSQDAAQGGRGLADGRSDAGVTAGSPAGASRAGASASAGTGARGASPAANSRNTGGNSPDQDAGPGVGAATVPDLEIVLRAVKAQAQLVPGKASEIWTLRGEVVRGPQSALRALPGAALGPILQVRRGQRLRITLDNQLSEQTILHWHGLRVPADMDGHPRYAIAPGDKYIYEFEVDNRAGTYLYHAHPDGHTGEQVYRGMAGLLIVQDDERDALALPEGEYDVPLVLQDRLFDANQQLVYQPTTQDMAGWLGDRVLVNGASNYVLSAGTRPYLLRVVNTSNARIYRLAWEDGTALTVVGTDGGLLARPLQRKYVMLAPGERVELWADWSTRAPGTELGLVSQDFSASAGSAGATAGRAQGAPLSLLRVRFQADASAHSPLPAQLSAFETYREADARNAATPRRIVPAMQHMSWTLNGRTFQMDQVAQDEQVKLDALELWQFDNSAANGGMMHGGMMVMPHPMHLHGGQFCRAEVGGWGAARRCQLLAWIR